MNKLDICNLRFADFAYVFNKACQRFSDVIEREGGRPCCYSDASRKKITSELAEVINNCLQLQLNNNIFMLQDTPITPCTHLHNIHNICNIRSAISAWRILVIILTRRVEGS